MRFFYILAVAITLCPIFYTQADTINRWSREAYQRPLVIAHRGGSHLFPENTMVAMCGAAALGVDVLEMDARLSADNILFLFHDNEIQRITGKDGVFYDYNASDLATMNAAAHFTSTPHDFVAIPKLRDVLQQFAETDIRFLIEIKDSAWRAEVAVHRLIQLIDHFSLHDRVMIASFYSKPIHQVRRHSTQWITSAPMVEATTIVLLDMLYLGWLYDSPPARALQLPQTSFGIPLGNANVVQRLHARTMAAHYWTINQREDMVKLIAAGADGIVTDRPDLLHTVLHNIGLAVPPPINACPDPKNPS